LVEITYVSFIKVTALVLIHKEEFFKSRIQSLTYLRLNRFTVRVNTARSPRFLYKRARHKPIPFVRKYECRVPLLIPISFAYILKPPAQSTFVIPLFHLYKRIIRMLCLNIVSGGCKVTHIVQIKSKDVL
jgi:hypothetical protein